MMFNGIINHTGKVYHIYKKDKSYNIQISSKLKFSKKEIGSSVSCSGACLTLHKIKGNLCCFYLS